MEEAGTDWGHIQWMHGGDWSGFEQTSPSRGAATPIFSRDAKGVKCVALVTP
jgi:hypothetical protein